MINNTEHVHLEDDGTSGEIHRLKFHNRTLHRVLSEAPDDERPGIARDALEIGGEVVARLSHHGDLDQVAGAIDRLDAEGKRIIDTTITAAGKVVGDTVSKLTEQLAAEDGPLAGLFDQFDPAVEGNVIEAFRDLVGSTIAKATKQAVTELTESTKEQVESLTTSLGVLEKVAAIEEARLEEAKRGTAKGRDHELDVELLLGDLVAVTGDGLDDVSNETGLDGTKKGDKVIRPRGGVAIVTEEKCTKPVTEAKARILLNEAMRNRGAALGMLIVDDETKVPGNQPYHLIDDDMVVVAADPITLRLVYCLMRSKAIEAAQAVRAVDDHAAVEALGAIRGHIDDIARALDRFKLIRTEHTKATKAIAQAAGYVDDLGAVITVDVTEITLLIKEVVGDDQPGEAA
jgi:hypothetical protein